MNGFGLQVFKNLADIISEQQIRQRRLKHSEIPDLSGNAGWALNHAEERNAEMKQKIKKYLLIGLAATVFYFILSNHYIVDGRDIYLLKKTSLHLHETFVSISNERPETILRNDILRDAGIGDLFVDLEIMTEEEKNLLESQYDAEY